MSSVIDENSLSSRSIWDHRRLAPSIVVVAMLGLSVLALVLSNDQLDRLFAETGPFERASFWLWLLLGGVLLWRAWAQAPAMACSAMSFLFAAREADWHKRWTADSLFKTNYYQDVPAPLVEKLLGASIAIAAIVLGMYLVYRGARLLRRDRRQHVWVQTTLLGVVLLAGTKFLDRLESVLAVRFDVVVGATTGGLIAALEEGGEMVAPLILLLAAFQYAHHRAKR